MKARPVLLIAVALGALLALFALMRHHDARAKHESMAPDARAGNTTSVSPATSADTRSPTDDPFPSAPTRDLVDRDAGAAAQLWQARAKRAAFARQVKEFGPEVARLMQLAPDEAWDPLVERAKDGDIAAATAAMLLATTCMGTTPGPKGPPPVMSFAERFYPTLSDPWKAFLNRIDENGRAEHDERMKHCEGVGNAIDFAMLMIDQFLRPENPDVAIEMAADNRDSAQAIADLRELLATSPSARGELLLGDRLLESNDAAEQAEGLAMLERLATTDAEAASRLAYCVASSCGAFRGDPASARRWLEYAAGLGDQSAISTLVSQLDAQGDLSGAWAWALFELDLALNGCFEFFQPSYAYIARAAKDEERLRKRLTPGDQNAGLATYYSISGQWEQKAEVRLSCAG